LKRVLSKQRRYLRQRYSLAGSECRSEGDRLWRIMHNISTDYSVFTVKGMVHEFHARKTAAALRRTAGDDRTESTTGPAAADWRRTRPPPFCAYGGRGGIPSRCALCPDGLAGYAADQ